jgi:hypothetical protein
VHAAAFTSLFQFTPAAVRTLLLFSGEKEADLWPTINLLRANGIGTIIDYAAE